jgi:hypothetical protein
MGKKLQILKILPQTWSFKEIQQVAKTSNYMVQTVKILVTEKGILSCSS